MIVLDASAVVDWPRLGREAVERTIEYQDLRGDDQLDVLWQILQHVVNHGTYHRGPITTMLPLARVSSLHTSSGHQVG